MASTADPRSPLAPALAAARLADAHGWEARQRRRPDGNLEVVVMRRGRLIRYLIDAGGISAVCETHPPVRRYIWGRRLLIAAAAWLAACLLVPQMVVAVAAGLGFGPIRLDREGGWADLVGGAWGAGFAGAFLLVLLCIFVGGNVGVLDGLAAARWDNKQWQEIPKLAGQAAVTPAQLETSERLAEKHDRAAYVRRLAGGTAELAAASDGRLHRYLLGEAGDLVQAEHSSVRLRERVGKAFGLLAVVSFIGVFAATIADAGGPAIFATFGASMLSMIVAQILTTDFRAQELAEPSDEWLEIRLPAEGD